MTAEAPAVHGRSASSLRGWSDGRGPLYHRLAAAVRGAIATGAMGDHLPSERDLAAELSISRTTAVAAYELLVDEGVIVRRSGSGTFVARRPAASAICEDPLDCVRAFFGQQ